MKSYALYLNEKQLGVFTIDKLRQLKAAGKLNKKGLKIREIQEVAKEIGINIERATQHVTGHITTEKTGKRFKATKLKTWALFLVSLALMIGSIGAGDTSEPNIVGGIASFGFLASIIWGLYNRCQIWWHHG